MAALPHQPPSVHFTFGSELRRHPSSMPSTLPGKGDNQQRGCVGRPLKELGGRTLVGQQGAQTPRKSHLNTSFSTCPHCSALLCPPPSSQSPAAKRNAPSHQRMPPGTLGTAPHPSSPGTRGSRSQALSLCPRACPLHAPVSLSLHRAASAPLPHMPPALPLLLPAWVPPPLPPLQQISLKCAAIWFQLSPIFFLVD